MEINNQINKKSQELAKLERKLALEKIKKRKAETRRKIELGGLVIKANMSAYSKDIVLGALVHAEQALKKEDGARLLYQSIGQAAFMGHTDQEDDKNNDTII